MNRLFRGRNFGVGSARSYDAIIIGAGIGGLTCANLLASKGLHVLLVEQHCFVGGRCSSFRHNGYTFDVGSHTFPLLGNPDTITGGLLDFLGIRTQWLPIDPADQFHLPDGTLFPVPADFTNYRAKLKNEFPQETKGLNEFFRLARQAYQVGLLSYYRSCNPDLLGSFGALTVREALNRLIHDQRLKLILTADCPRRTNPPSGTPFVSDSMQRISSFLGNYYPMGGSQAFADELARRFEENGGDILLNSSVQKIVVNGQTVNGILVKTGHGENRRTQKVHADAVISSADMQQTVDRLVSSERMPPEFVAMVRRLRPSYRCFLMHFGLKGISTQALQRIHGYHWASWDADRFGENAFIFKLFVPTLYDPTLAPRGCHILIAQKVMAAHHASVMNWPAQKEQIEQFVLDHLERLIPSFSDYVDVRTGDSASMSQPYIGNSPAATLGWELTPDQLGDNHSGFESPLRDLYFIDPWTQPGGDITSVLVSAVTAASSVLARHGEFSPRSIEDPETATLDFIGDAL